MVGVHIYKRGDANTTFGESLPHVAVQCSGLVSHTVSDENIRIDQVSFALQSRAPVTFVRIVFLSNNQVFCFRTKAVFGHVQLCQNNAC